LVQDAEQKRIRHSAYDDSGCVRAVAASSIRTTKVSCTGGKAVIRSLLSRVGSSASCRRAADRPPPTTGCVVSGYHCFRRRSPDYCATTSGKVVQWRENHVLSGAPPR
jgi:hypothetical protein